MIAASNRWYLSQVSYSTLNSPSCVLKWLWRQAADLQGQWQTWHTKVKVLTGLIGSAWEILSFCTTICLFQSRYRPAYLTPYNTLCYQVTAEHWMTMVCQCETSYGSQYTHTHTHKCIYTHIYIYIYIYIYTHTHTHKHIYIHTHVHIYKHTYIPHTFTYIYTQRNICIFLSFNFFLD